MKKIISVLLVFVMCMSLCACGGESEEVTQAKECIDAIYQNTSDMVTLEMGISNLSSKSKLTNEEQKRLNLLEVDYAACKKLLELNTNILGMNYEKMSEKEREIIKEYIEEAYLKYLIDIDWGF